MYFIKMINPIHSTSLSEYNIAHYNKLRINDKTANSMPNGLQRVSEIKENKYISGKLLNDPKKQIFTTSLAPSIGFLTENFVKSRSLLSPIYRNNEAIAKYEAISISPLSLTTVKKDLDRIA